MKRNSMLVLAVLVLFSTGLYAESIDYVSSNISPAATFHGVSGNWTVIDSVAMGSEIAFDLTYRIVNNGNTTTYPRTVIFGANTERKPAGANNPVVMGLGSCTFYSSSTTCTANVRILAPSIFGNYAIKILPTSGFGGPNGLSSNGGVAISFTVAEASTQIETALLVTLSDSGCIIYRQPEVALSAQLVTRDGSQPVEGKLIDFMVNGQSAGSAVTGADGLASLNFDPSALAVGNYTVTASFDGDASYKESTDNENLGVSYLFRGFQQPINADGSSVFSGRVIPAKIKIADYYGYSVPNAAAHVFFRMLTLNSIGTEMEATAVNFPDSGNQMRYDATADQYIFNWDTSTLSNGSYSIRVGLNEGRCSGEHSVLISIKKKNGK